MLGAVLLCYAAEVFVCLFGNAYQERLVALAGLYVTLSVSLNMINGITGQFSIGHAAFYQIGAYTVGYLSLLAPVSMGYNSISWLAMMMLVAAITAGFAGFIVGLPSLRLKGDYLAIVTLGFGEIVRILVQNMDVVGGSYGMNVNPKIQHLSIIWLLAIICIGVFRNILKTGKGLVFTAVRDDEIASASVGIPVTKVKVTAFVMGSAFAGAAGALFAHYEGFITPGAFTMDLSFMILTMVMVGGSGSITGSVVAAISLFYLPEWLRDQPNITAASFLSAIFASGVFIFTLSKAMDRYYQNTFQKISAISFAVCASVGFKYLSTFFLELVPQLRDMEFEGNQLRMVIFAAILVVLMLIRPQGLLSNFELSWKGIQKLISKTLHAVRRGV